MNYFNMQISIHYHIHNNIYMEPGSQPAQLFVLFIAKLEYIIIDTVLGNGQFQ